jgi:DNA-binding CsgD family transcriptional regulator
MTVFLATLGQRPEAIMMAFDRLLSRFEYTRLSLLHTDPDKSGIRQSLTEFRDAMADHFPQIDVSYHLLRYADDLPLIDVTDVISAAAYFEAVLNVLIRYRQSGERLHLLVAGGRKAMSIYAMMAAARVFDPPLDCVWTVLSSPAVIEQRHVYRIPPGQREQVQLVELPILPARLAPGTDPRSIQPRSRADAFVNKLSREERTLVNLLVQQPYASNAELARALVKSPSTIENQFGSIYAKLVGFLEAGETIPDSAKRVALLDVVRGNFA